MFISPIFHQICCFIKSLPPKLSIVHWFVDDFSRLSNASRHISELCSPTYIAIIDHLWIPWNPIFSWFDDHFPMVSWAGGPPLIGLAHAELIETPKLLAVGNQLLESSSTFHRECHLLHWHNQQSLGYNTVDGRNPAPPGMVESL